MNIFVGNARDITNISLNYANNWASKEKVLYIDGGNNFSPYYFYKIHNNPKKTREILNNILISRPFTIYQLKQLIKNLDSSLNETCAKKLIVSRLSDLFSDEDISSIEREAIIRHISKKLREIKCSDAIITLNKNGKNWNKKILEELKWGEQFQVIE